MNASSGPGIRGESYNGVDNPAYYDEGNVDVLPFTAGGFYCHDANGGDGASLATIAVDADLPSHP
jgi:hypothetical protein